MLDTLTTVVSFILVLGVLVFFHELGHYWVARRNGIVVEEFGMGYPPRLVKLFTYDGTIFTLNLIPFGGFARMKGEDAGDMSSGSFNAASRGGRAATLFAGPLMNGILAVFLFAASFLAGFPAPVSFPQIDESAATVAAEFGLQPGDILLDSNNEPVYVRATSALDYDIIPDEGVAHDGGKIRISRQGEILTIPLPSGTSIEQILESASHTPVLTTQITLVAPGSPAEKAKLQVGDLFYMVNDGEKDIVLTEINPLNQIIQQNLGKEVAITLLRTTEAKESKEASGDALQPKREWVEVVIRPRLREETPTGEGALGVGIDTTHKLATLSVLDSLWQGVVNTWGYITLVLQLPFLLIADRIALSDAELTGPVGIAQLVGGAVSATIDTGLWYPIWRLSGILSAALAITNMLPLPALDGGRLLFILIETIRGRRVNPEREGFIHMIGFVLLLGLIVFITVRDISASREAIDWLSILGQ